MKLKPATIHDVPRLIEIRRRAILAQPETFWNSAEKERAASHWNKLDIGKHFENHVAYIFEDSGFVAWCESYLSALFLLPEEQKVGTGSLLLKFAESEIKKTHDHIWLLAHPYTEKFYEKHGYKKQAETENPFGTKPLHKFLKSF